MEKLSDKCIEKSRLIDASTAEIYTKWTTHEGLKSFFGADNFIELKLNGAFEIYFLMDQPEGNRGSEGCKVLSFIPNEMFSFTWNAPPHLEARHSDIQTYVVVNLDEISDDKTIVTLRHLGWPEDERFSPVYEYFDQAWDFVMDHLVENFNTTI